MNKKAFNYFVILITVLLFLPAAKSAYGQGKYEMWVSTPPELTKWELVESRDFRINNITTDGYRLWGVGWDSIYLFDWDQSQWKKIGGAVNVSGLAYANGKLYAASSHDERLWVTDADKIAWRPIGKIANVVAMTSDGSRLFAATSLEKMYLRYASESDEQWQLTSSAPKIRAMTFIGNSCWAAVIGGHLMKWDWDKNPPDWSYTDARMGAITGIAYLDGRLWKVTVPVEEIGNKYGWERSVPRSSGTNGGGSSATKTVCAGQVPAGWIRYDDFRDPTQCNGGSVLGRNVWRIERYDNKAVGASISVCLTSPPGGWELVEKKRDISRCGGSEILGENVMTIRRVK